MRKFVLSMALMLGVVAAMAQTTKAEATVTFGKGAGAVTGSAYLYDNYGFLLNLPAENSKICLTDTVFGTFKVKKSNGDWATRSMKYHTGILPMDTAGWPASAKQQYEEKIHICFGDQMGADLKNFYSFSSATIGVTVKANGTDLPFAYLVAAQTPGTLSGVTAKADVDAAIELVKTQATRTASAENYVLIKAGSSIQYGEERMDFNNDVKLAKKDMKFEKILQAISENTTIRKPGITGADTCKAEILLLAGSAIAAKSELAVLNQDMTVSIDASGANENAPILKNALSTLKGYADANDRTNFFKFGAKLLNCIAGKIDGNQLVPVVVEFDEIPWEVIRGVEEVMNSNNEQALTPGMIGTFCLPYSVSQTRGGIVYSLEYKIGEGDNVEAVALVEATYPLVARQPYVFVASADKLEGILGDEFYLTTPTPLAYNGLVGGDFENPTTVGVGNYLVSGNMLRLCNVECFIAPGRAYVNMADVPAAAPVNPAPARRMLIGKQGVASDVINNEAGVQAVKTIENGEFVIIKNGVKYNAAGVVME